MCCRSEGLARTQETPFQPNTWVPHVYVSPFSDKSAACVNCLRKRRLAVFKWGENRSLFGVISFAESTELDSFLGVYLDKTKIMGTL